MSDSAAPSIPPPPSTMATRPYPVLYHGEILYPYLNGSSTAGTSTADTTFQPGPYQYTPMFYTKREPDLATKILRQINYYFSTENLVKDIYLRQRMDADGWVPISLIANFNKIKELTNNVSFILNALQVSVLVEVQGDKVRRKNGWQKWILPARIYSST